MAVYDKNGNALSAVYDKTGAPLDVAYDRNGNIVFQKNPTTLKVMAYNCGQWYIGSHDNVPADRDAEYYALQNGIIESVDADVLLLEEYTAQFSKAGRTALSMLQSKYPYYHEQTDGSTTTVAQRAIFSKYPISSYSAHSFGGAGSGYYYDTCFLTVDRFNIFLVVTHLHWNNLTERAREAGILISAVQNHPRFIIGGDFNLVDFYSINGEDYQQVIKPFVDKGYNIANGGAFGFIPTYCDTADGAEWTNLDEIVTSANITIDSVTTDKTKVTDSINDKIDHLPLIAELTIS